jgi:NADH:ubiquinone oxidoreductase subunit 3 (subunit A)
MIDLLMPPVAFLVVLTLAFILSGIMQVFSIKGKKEAGKEKSYACGEDVVTNKAQPDYGQFFPFAFFFTIMHVLVLMIATVTKGILGLPLLYIGAGVVSLFILYRR